MSDFTVTVIGTGVIGTSLGLALKQQGDDSLRMVAHDKELVNAKESAKMGAFDKTEWNLINACEQADLIILAIPTNGVKHTFEAIAPYLKEGVVVSDTTRNKLAALAWAKEFLPDHAHFVGGDPIVHPAGSGYKHASADLFKGRLYCLTPASSIHEDAVQVMTGIVNLIGGESFFLDAAEHDGLVTATELLPNLLGTTLINTLSEQISWRETRKLAGSLFERVSSGAEGDPDTLAAAYLENRETLLHWLDQYATRLNEIRSLLMADDDPHEAIAQVSDKAIVTRRNWLKDFQKGDFLDPELQSPKVERPNIFSQMIGFGRLRKKNDNLPKK